jgi:hypothetical protein
MELPMPFDQEWRTFRAKLHELRTAHEGEFVLIHGAEILGIFPTYKEAIQAGHDKIGLDRPFFVNWIKPLDRWFVASPAVISGKEPDDGYLEKMLEDFDARIRQEYGDLDTYVRKIFKLDRESSHRT